MVTFGSFTGRRILDKDKGRILNNFGFWISDFGYRVKYLYFLRNSKDYTSEIQHPTSEINSLYNPSYSTISQLIIHHSHACCHQLYFRSH